MCKTRATAASTAWVLAGMVAALALTAGPAGAQAQPRTQPQGNPAFVTPASEAPASAPAANPQDRLFVLLVGQGGLAEVDLARLADGKTQNAAVKQFARRMLDEHSSANAQLVATARQAGLVPPAQPSADQQAMRTRLAGLSGAAFDEAYLRGQLVEHQKTAQLLEWEMGSGQQVPLQRFAAATLPAVLDHLRHVQHLLTTLTGAASDAAAMP
jgi:putative membrane protein